MTSISYSAAASTAVRVLQSVNRDIATTQNRIATGLRINSATDDAAIWNAATQLRTDIEAYEEAETSLNFNKALFSSSAATAKAAEDILIQIQTVVATGVAAASGSAARDDAQNELVYLQLQLSGVIEDAEFGGRNLLKGGASVVSMIGFSMDGGSVAGAFIPENLLDTTAGHVLDADAAKFGSDFGGQPATVLTMTIDGVEAAAGAAATAIQQTAQTASNYATRLGAVGSRIQISQEYFAKIADIKKGALSGLVDANMEQETVKLVALQVRQQLATQALLIANQSSQAVLRLFQ